MKNMNKRKLLLLAAVAALLLAGVGGTVAYIVTQTEPVINTFEATNVAVSVGSSGVITNTGSIDAYIRAAVVATWQDDSRNVHAMAPEYTVSGTNWEQHTDSFYYYNSAVAPGASTSELSVTCDNSDDSPDGYVFTVEILAQAIQAEPADVVTKVWGWTPPADADASDE